VSALGQPLDRTDGAAKVQGAARYAGDFALPRMAHAMLVQSTVPAGRASVDAGEARRMPGVLDVMTPANAPRLAATEEGESPLRVLSLLQDDRVHYNGQPVALVVARTPEQARDAAHRVLVRYAREDARLDFAALRKTAVKPARANQHPTDVRWGDFDAGLRDAAAKVDAVYATPPQYHNPLEPHATLAQWEGGRLTVYDSTQGVFGCRTTLARHFGLAPEDVRVLSPFVGGGFGCKGSAWSHVVLCAMAARLAGRPVKLVLDRPQMFGPVGGRPRTEQRLVLGATREGRLSALSHAVLTETSLLEDWVEPSAAATRVLYACANGDTRHRLVRLNRGTPTFQRAPGEASGTFALEVALDELAERLDLDPLELRLRNDTDRTPAEGKPFSSRNLRECYLQGAERFGWSRRPRRPGTLREGDWRIGYGMATATYPANRSKAAALAILQPDGSAVVRAGTQDIGTGTYTVMTQVAADALGLPVDRVRFELGDTRFPETPVSGGSQTVASVGSAVHAACMALRERLLAAALAGEDSPFRGEAPAGLATDQGWIASSGTPSRRESYASVIARHGGQPIEARVETPAPKEAKERFALHSFGAVFAEVRVDRDLGTLRLERLHGTYDVGRRLNEKLATSQLMGGIVWAASFALFEDALFDLATGHVANANLAEYHVPVNADIGEVDVRFVDSQDLHLDPLGARGIGEIGITGMTAAIANAVWHATGTRVRNLPIRLDALLG
jgi:xanthine dehydrogenase YagR molybdenum-binding subunit